MKRIWNRLLITMLATALFWAGCQQAAPQSDSTAGPAATTPLSMKGMELYSWQDEFGNWQFAILPGTNRQKTAQDLFAAAVTLETVKTAFGQLSPGETLFWNHPLMLADTDRLRLVMPPGEVISTLRAHAAVADVELILPVQ